MIAGVVRKLVESLQSTGQINSKAKSDHQIEEMLFRLILGFPPDAARCEDVIEIFGKNYCPGTFTIAEIEHNPNFLCGETSIGYEPWVRQEIGRDIKAMIDVGLLNACTTGISEVKDDVLEILSYKFDNGQCLRDLIGLQEYTDIFRRLILALLLGNPEAEFNTYEELNDVGGAIALDIVAKLDDRPLSELLKMSISAGLIGLNLKTSAAATSRIHNSGIIAIDPHKRPSLQVEEVLHCLLKKASQKMAIDYWKDYEARVLRADPMTLVVFTDDYIETIFDLKLIERQLNDNPNLRVWLIPRARRYGNDASYEDVMNLLGEPVFRNLKSLNKHGRFDICASGPRLGTVNGLKISQRVADLLKRCDAVFVKGARAYEMLQGIGKLTYFGFAVCREISEAVTGIDAETGDVVFIRQMPYQRTFLGFRNRTSRPYKFGNRISFLCLVTAKDCYEQDLLPSFYKKLCEDGRRDLQKRVIQIVPFLDDLRKDIRRGLTLIVRPSLQVERQLTAINQHLRKVAPHHFYYEASRFHFSIISLITAYETFDLKKTPLQLYERTIREVLSIFPPFDVEFAGVGATRSSIIAKGFPIGGTLEAIREMLRQRLRSAGLGRGIDERYRSLSAHVTLGRLKVMDDFDPLIACLDKLHEVQLERMCVSQAQLVINDFYMSPDKVRLIADIELAGPLEGG